MPRVPQLLTLLACALVALGAALPAASNGKATAAAKGISLSATLGACKVTKGQRTGEALFVGSMPRVSGAVRMEMRFDLLQSASNEGDFRELAVPRWGEWVKSQTGRPGFVYKKRIVGLTAPGSYRAKITFRWRNASGKVVRKVTKRTPVCRQPDTRPNLTVTGVSFGGHDRASDTVTYVVKVRNSGRSEASAFVTRLLVPGADPLTAGVSGLEARSRVDVELEGPACLPGSTIDIAVDVEGAVEEADESDNALTVACPVPRR